MTQPHYTPVSSAQNWEGGGGEEVKKLGG